MSPTPSAPSPQFAEQLERRIRRALAPLLAQDQGGTAMRKPLNRHGHVSYLEIPAADAALSADFYEAVFGWSIRARDTNRSSFEDPGGDLIGAWETGETSLQVFISVDSVDRTLELITANGGEVVRPPYPEGGLTVATFRDPAGNVMGIWEMDPADAAPAASITPAISPGLNCRDAHATMRWLTDVLGFRLDALFEEPDGRVAYAQLVRGSAAVNVSTREDVRRLPDTGPASLVLTVEDGAAVDRLYARAVDAGAEVLLPVEASFYGGYGFTLRDPEGNLWNVGKPFLDTEEARGLPQRRL